jgi:hypothetical protein
MTSPTSHTYSESPHEIRRGTSIWKLSLAAFAFVVACGVSPKTTPTLDIDSPGKNSSVNVGSAGLVAVTFSTNFTLKSPGTCAGEDACGYVTLLVDSSDCNQEGLAYNTLAVASPTDVNLSLCKTAVAGQHTITIELLKDDGSIVKDLAGNPVTDDVTITAETE